jgi:hypothetical protein
VLLTSTQVAEQLGVTRAVLKRLVRDGQLAPANERKPSAGKFFMKFEQADVRNYIKAQREARQARPALAMPSLPAPVPANGNGHHVAPVGLTLSMPGGVLSQMEGIAARLDRIEGQLAALIAAWS